eukprot:3586953-Pyramimonas_sp.AAC.1
MAPTEAQRRSQDGSKRLPGEAQLRLQDGSRRDSNKAKLGRALRPNIGSKRGSICSGGMFLQGDGAASELPNP